MNQQGPRPGRGCASSVFKCKMDLQPTRDSGPASVDEVTESRNKVADARPLGINGRQPAVRCAMGYEHNGQLDACIGAALGGTAGVVAGRAGGGSIAALACRMSP